MHFSREEAVFEAGRGKNPNFREVKREDEKLRFGGFVQDNCRNQGIIGTDKAIFAGFHHHSKQKNERQLCIKVSVQRWCGKQDLNLHERNVH